MRVCALALAGLISLALIAGCASTTLNTPHAVLERSETAGELLYQETVTALDEAVATGSISQATHDADWRTAWADLSAFRTAYNLGQDVTAAAAALRGDLAAAKGAGK